MVVTMEQPSITAIDKVSVAKICSGQVITDLATAVKELVENSLVSTAGDSAGHEPSNVSPWYSPLSSDRRPRAFQKPSYKNVPTVQKILGFVSKFEFQKASYQLPARTHGASCIYVQGCSPGNTTMEAESRERRYVEHRRTEHSGMLLSCLDQLVFSNFITRVLPTAAFNFAAVRRACSSGA